MTMQDLHSNVLPVRAIAPQTITSSALVSGNLDLAGFNSAQVVADFGTTEGFSGSPSGSIAIKLEHADDDGTGSPGTYANVALTDVVGPSSVTSGVVATVTSETVTRVGYVGDKRFLRVTFTPTGLGNGGPCGALLLKGNARHGPAS